MSDAGGAVARIHITYVTFVSIDEAERVARAVVRERLAACANLNAGAKSIFTWKGELLEERECIGVFKSTEDKLETLHARIIELHSYECPCVVSWPLSRGNIPFLKWIEESTQEGERAPVE